MSSSARSGEPPLQDLLRKTARDGAAWIEAELAVAREAAGSAASHCVSGIILGIFAAVTLLAAQVVLSHAAVLALAPHVGGYLNAAAAVGLVLLLLGAALLFAARQTFQGTRRELEHVRRWMP